MKRQKNIQSISRSSDSSSSTSISNTSSSIEINKTHEISDEAEQGEYSDRKWRILMSDKLGRPFFYNTETKIGQFTIPAEFTSTTAQEQEHPSFEKSLYPCKSQDDTESIPAATEVFDLSTSDSPKKTNDDDFQAVYSKKVKTEKNTTSLLWKEDYLDPMNFSGVHSSENKSRATIDIDRIDNQLGNDDSEESMCITEDICSDKFHNTLTVCNSKEEEMPLDHTQIDSQIGFHEPTLSSNMLNSEGDRDGDGDGGDDGDGDVEDIVTNEKKWACTACTFENNNEVFSCAMCGHPSGLSKLRRSQRDSHVNTGSGSIMHGFSLSQNHGLGSTQTQQTQSSTDLGIFPTPRGNTNILSNRRLSSTPSVISHGSSSKSQQNNRKKR